MIRIYLAIYLVSAATLTYEIGLTRLFSVAQGYHFAFMAVSIALMGIGAGGAMLMVFRRFVDWDMSRALYTLATLFSLIVILSFILSNHILFDPVKAAWSRFEFLKILAQYIILSLPFIVSGMIISLSIRKLSGLVHRIYLADMVGASTGCVLVLYILSKSGGELAVVVASTLALSASLLFYMPAKAKEFVLSLMAFFLLMLAAFGPNWILEIRLSPYRDLSSILNFPGGRVVETIFSPSGRLDIVDSPAVRSAPGMSLTYQSPLPPQLGFTINGGGLFTVTSREDDISFLRHLPSSLAYRLRGEGDVFIVEPGGGMEVLSALENGASGVWGAETRGVVLQTMKENLLGFSGGLYKEAEIRHGYGRSILKELDLNFDIIQLPLTGTLGASSSGIKGLQEEYNLTVEAFIDYMKHLKDGGVISTSLYLLPPPRQEIKLLSTVVKALEVSGIEKVGDNILAIRSWGVMTLLFKKTRFDERDIDLLKGFCNEERFDLIWYPGMEEDEANRFNQFPRPLYYELFKKVLEGEGRETFFGEYIYDISPSIDNRPFFGHTFKMTRMRETYESVGRKWGILIEGGYLLPWILIQSALAGFVLIMLPLLVVKREAIFKRGFLLPITVYFSAIGMGYIFIEIVLIQRMIPVLGEPIYAISAVLFSLLLSTGVGSYLSGRFMLIDRYSIHSILIVPLFIILYLLILGTVTDRIIGMGMTLRFLTTFLFLFPLGAVMGIPFPTGMSILGKRQADLIPWAWCINGSFSVIGTTLIMMVALSYGFHAVQVIAALLYLMAWLALLRLSNAG
ncbi:MAG: hypothetical protein V3T96_02605 [Thermodesulfobacteriota bacterium]